MSLLITHARGHAVTESVLFTLKPVRGLYMARKQEVDPSDQHLTWYLKPAVIRHDGEYALLVTFCQARTLLAF